MSKGKQRCDLQTAIDNLLISAARVLFKFTEDKETYSEWRDLCQTLKTVAPHSKDNYVRKRVAATCEDFDRRRKQ